MEQFDYNYFRQNEDENMMEKWIDYLSTDIVLQDDDAYYKPIQEKINKFNINKNIEPKNLNTKSDVYIHKFNIIQHIKLNEIDNIKQCLNYLTNHCLVFTKFKDYKLMNKFSKQYNCPAIDLIYYIKLAIKYDSWGTFIHLWDFRLEYILKMNNFYNTIKYQIYQDVEFLQNILLSTTYFESKNIINHIFENELQLFGNKLNIFNLCCTSIQFNKYNSFTYYIAKWPQSHTNIVQLFYDKLYYMAKDYQRSKIALFILNLKK